MEHIEEYLTQLLENEAIFLRVCNSYLHSGRKIPEKVQEYVRGLLAVHNVRFDEIDAQLTRLENMVEEDNLVKVFV